VPARAVPLVGRDTELSRLTGWVADLAVVTGRRPADLAPALADARAAGVLAEAGARRAFRHPLIHIALYHQLPPPTRAAWHLAAAHALRHAGAGPVRVAGQLLPALTGHHDQPAQRIADWVVDWLVQASPELAGVASEAAVRLLRATIPTCPPPPQPCQPPGPSAEPPKRQRRGRGAGHPDAAARERPRRPRRPARRPGQGPRRDTRTAARDTRRDRPDADHGPHAHPASPQPARRDRRTRPLSAQLRSGQRRAHRQLDSSLGRSHASWGRPGHRPAIHTPQ
jgi:hypothetical protein